MKQISKCFVEDFVRDFCSHVIVWKNKEQRNIV